MGMQDDDTVPVGADVPVSAYSNKYSVFVQLRYSFRLYPSPGQQQALARAFGCARVVFNDALAAAGTHTPPGGRTPPTRSCRSG